MESEAYACAIVPGKSPHRDPTHEVCAGIEHGFVMELIIACVDCTMIHACFMCRNIQHWSRLAPALPDNGLSRRLLHPIPISPTLRPDAVSTQGHRLLLGLGYINL